MKDYTILLTTEAGTAISFGHIAYVTSKPWNGGKLTGPMIEVEKRNDEDAIAYLHAKSA